MVDEENTDEEIEEERERREQTKARTITISKPFVHMMLIDHVNCLRQFNPMRSHEITLEASAAKVKFQTLGKVALAAPELPDSDVEEDEKDKATQVNSGCKAGPCLMLLC